MDIFRSCLAGGLLALTACSAQAEPAWDGGAKEVVEAVTEPPDVLADLPYYAGVAGNDQVHGNVLTDMVRKAIQERDFATLNAFARYFRTTRSRLPGGTWELDTFHLAVRRALEGPLFASSPCELKGTDFTDSWAAHDPDQPAPYIAKATLLVSYGWCVRGGEYARDVPPLAMWTFNENIDAAYEVLIDNAAVARRDPEFYALMAKIYNAQGRRGVEFQRLVDEGSARFPYYYGIYFEAAWHEMPQWGGSRAQVEAIARYAAERTREQDGEGAYARVFWWILECGCELDELDDFPIDRARLARAMDDIFERYPSNWNAANFARIACRLGDRELTARQFARGESEESEHWEDPDEWRRCRQFAGLAPRPIARR